MGPRGFSAFPTQAGAGMFAPSQNLQRALVCRAGNVWGTLGDFRPHPFCAGTGFVSAKKAVSGFQRAAGGPWPRLGGGPWEPGKRLLIRGGCLGKFPQKGPWGADFPSGGGGGRVVAGPSWFGFPGQKGGGTGTGGRVGGQVRALCGGAGAYSGGKGRWACGAQASPVLRARKGLQGAPEKN